MDSLNNCWRCSYKNISNATQCAIACTTNGRHTVQTPTRDANSMPMSYHVLSFGQRADQLHCQRIHASKLDEAMHVFRSRTLVAVRVGVQPNFAIIIKDADGTNRRTIDVTPGLASGFPPGTGDAITDFLNMARVILLTDPDQNAGTKTFFYID
jgi:hypothetical protein